MTSPTDNELREEIIKTLVKAEGLAAGIRLSLHEKDAEALMSLIQRERDKARLDEITLLESLLGKVEEYEQWVGASQYTGQARKVNAVPVSAITELIKERR